MYNNSLYIYNNNKNNSNYLKWTILKLKNLSIIIIIINNNNNNNIFFQIHKIFNSKLPFNPLPFNSKN